MQVQDTNNFSIGSKRSMCDAGYFEDDFIKTFCPKSHKRSPLINYGYCVRAVVIDYLLKFFKNKWSNSHYQVISLGAGYDTSYFRLFHNIRNIKYIEVDLEDVVKHKKSAILENESTRSLLTGYQDHSDGNVGLQSTNYTLIPLDLETDDIAKILSKGNVNFGEKTLIFSECAITYMEESRYSNLIRVLSKLFPNSALAVYEQACTSDGFGLFMTQHFKRIGTPLKGLSLLENTSISHRVAYFQNKGWPWCEGFSAQEVYTSCLESEEQMRHAKTEPFDEWEELHLKAAHYTLILAASKTMTTFCSDFCKTIKKDPCYGDRITARIEKYDAGLLRYSHSITDCGKEILILGGVDKAGRSNDVVFLDAKTGRCRFVSDGPTVINTTAVIEGEDILLFGGRLSPSKEIYHEPYLYTIQSNSLEPFGVLKNSSSPPPRYRHSFIKTSNGPYLFGGRNHVLQLLNDLWLLNGKSWKQCVSSGPQPCPRFSHSATADEHFMYVSGGLGSDLVALNDVWRLDLRSLKWEQLQIAGLIPRYSHSSHVVGNKLILVGGVNSNHSFQPGIAVIDLSFSTNSELQLPACLEETPQEILMVFKHSSLISPCGGFIIILGGGGNCFSFGTHFSPCFRLPLSQFEV